jgi:hypothetical protein
VDEACVDLYWLPLGAGGHSVRVNGRVFEWIEARRAGREPLALYHSALEVSLGSERFVIEVAPESRSAHGVVAGGAVGSRLAGVVRLFRYEVRCWVGGSIPDIDEAVGSPRRVSDDRAVARAVLELAPCVPVPVWGRDELGGGEMWNSNSVISWLLVSAGVDAEQIALPPGGRAPGWDAGIVVARRI